MINELTKEQENQLSVYRDKWLKIGLSTESIDKKKASTAIDLMYKCGGLDAPEYKIFVDSPISMLYAYIYLQAIFSEQVLDQVRGQVYSQINGQVREQVWEQVGDQVSEQVGDQVSDQVYSQIGDHINNQVANQVRAHVLDQVLDQVSDQVYSQISGQVLDQVWGQIGDQIMDRILNQVRDQVRGQVWNQVKGQIGVKVGEQVKGKVRSQVWGKVGEQVRGQISGQVSEQVGDQVANQVRAHVLDQVLNEVRGKVGGQVLDQVRGKAWYQVRNPVKGKVGRQVLDKVLDQVRDQIRQQVKEQVSDQVLEQVAGQVVEQVEGQVRGHISNQVRGQVYSQISGQVREQVWDQVWDQVWYQVENADIEKTWKDIRFNIYHGSHDATWLSFYNYFQEVCGLECTKPLDGLFETAMHCGWILPFKNAAIICAKPNVIKFDSQNRLHCDSGPALSYNDGFGVFAWHGTRVASWVITNPELITIDKIFVEENAEIRRILMERYGLRKFGHDLITSGKASLIHEEEVWGEPVRYYKYNDKGARLGFVHVINGTVEPDGTKHEFILTVKADYKTASEAVYSTYPELMKRLDNLPEDVRMNILKQSIRT